MKLNEFSFNKPNHKSLKIVHMTSVHPVFDTRIFHKECIGLVKSDHRVTLIAPHVVNESINGVKIVAVTPGRKRFSRMFKTTFEVFSWALKEKADLYHIHDPELLFCAHLLRLSGRRVVFDMHENLPKALLTKSWLRPVLRKGLSRLVQWAERLFLYRLPVVFAETSYRRDYPGVKYSADVLNMPDPESFLQSSVAKFAVPTLGYVGAVTAERGSLATFKALEITHKAGHRVEFECIGPVRGEQQKAYLRNMETHIAQGIRLAGYLCPTEAWQKIAQCHIGLAILQPTPNYLESYPTKMFEYMAMGLPVIVSDFPLYRDVVEKYRCGICVDPNSPTAIAAAITALIEDPATAEKMGAAGKQAVIDKFNWQHEIDKLHSLYTQVLSH